MTRRAHRSDRRRFRRRAVLALVVALVVAGAAEGATRYWEDDIPESIEWYDASAQRKIEQMEHRGSADVVFAGTSMAWQGLDPTTFTSIDPAGRSAYNAGLAGGVPGVMEPWLLDEVTPRLEPELVVWGLSTLDIAPNYGDDNAQAYADAPQAAPGVMAELDRRAGALSALVRHRRTLRDPDLLWGDEGDEELFEAADAILGPDGQRREFDVTPDAGRARSAATRLIGWEPSKADLDRIRVTVTELLARGIDVVLTPMPVPPRFIELHPDGVDDLLSFDRALSKLASELEVPWIDVAHGYEDDDFVDYTHLDHDGAVRFTRQLTAEIDRTTRQVPPSQEWEIIADVALDTTPSTARRRTGIETRARSLGERAVLATEGLHGAVSPGLDIYGIEIPLVWANGDQRAKELQLTEMAEAGDAPEVLFTGTSKVWFGVDTLLFTELDGRSSYNAGLGSAGPLAQQTWLLDAIEPRVRPELVVWGLSAYDLSGRLEATARHIADATDLHEAMFEDVAWSELLDGVERVDHDIPEIWEADPAEVGTETGGQRRSPFIGFDQTRANGVSYFIGGATEADPRELDRISATVGELRSRGVEVVLMSMPVPDAFRELQPEGAPDRMTAQLVDLAERIGVDHLDLTHTMPDEAFADFTHLEARGAAEFTRMLTAELQALDTE